MGAIDDIQKAMIGDFRASRNVVDGKAASLAITLLHALVTEKGMYIVYLRLIEKDRQGRTSVLKEDLRH